MIILTNEILTLVEDNNAFIVLIKSIAKRASYDNNQSCFPSLNTMALDSGFSKPTVIKACKYLKDIGIITIQKRCNKNSKENYSNFYCIDTDLIKVVGGLKAEIAVNDIDKGSKGDLPPSKGDLLPLVKEIDCNLKTNLTSRSINNIKKELNFNSINYIQELKLDSTVEENLLDWLEIRKIKKTATTKKAIDIILTKLNEFELKTQIQMIQNSISNGWIGIFEIKPNFNNVPQKIDTSVTQVKPNKTINRKDFNSDLEFEKEVEIYQELYTDYNLTIIK
jgi:hypothetical protein